METATINREQFQKSFNEERYNVERSNTITNPCQPPQFFHNQQAHKSNYPDQRQSVMARNDILKTLFGTEDASWSYSDQALEKALELKMCQEKTKQEYYKVEAISRSIELMKLVAVAKIPTNLIPCVFGQPQQASMTAMSGPVVSAPIVPNQLSTPETSVQCTPLQSPTSPSPRRNLHVRGKTISNMNDLQDTPFLRTERTNDNSSSSMSSYKFGAGSSVTPQRRTTLAPKHQLSPSRIGAHAISSLSRETGVRKNISIQRLRHGSNHQRTLSLPTSVSIPEMTSVEFHRPSYATKSSIYIPDLTGKTPNSALISQKKRKVNSIQGFEFYKPNLSVEREEISNPEENHNNQNEDGDETIEDITL